MDILNEADRIHLLSEATKLAYHQRDAYISDPSFNEIPVDWLLSDDHIGTLQKKIDMAEAKSYDPSDFPSHTDTTYLCLSLIHI